MTKSPDNNLLGTKDRLSVILEPVKPELEILETRIRECLSSNNSFLDNVVRYIISAGGKRLRPAVSFLIAKALNKGFISSNHFQLGQALELIHTATIIHDDVIDVTETRRNIETINKLWDDKTAVIAGDFLLSKSLIKLAAVKNYSVIEIFANTMSKLCEGEIQQNIQDYEIISLEDYIAKSRRKTAYLFMIGAECAAILTPNADNFIIKIAKEYALNFGIAFQIVDDILNFTSSEEELGKPVGIDLKDGILTAPVLFALEYYEQKDDDRLKDLIDTRFIDNKSFNTALELVLNSDGIKKAKELANSYIETAKSCVKELEDSPYKSSLIELADYVLSRRH